MSTDMSNTIKAKSDQLNTDDLISGAITVKITEVNVVGNEQPVAISYEGDNGKPYKPCKSMCRVLVMAWGAEGTRYVGQSMTLYRDPTVTWAGKEVGGIRISHMSGLDQRLVMALTATRGSKKSYVVEVLEAPKKEPTQAEKAVSALGWVVKQTAVIAAIQTTEEVGQFPVVNADIVNKVSAYPDAEDALNKLLKNRIDELNIKAAE